MPYFHTDAINMLFIHIPKTGGTSIEMYFSNRYNVPLNIQSMYSKDGTTKGVDNNISLQHQLYRDLYKNREGYGVAFDRTLKIITIVRNPYERIISDLFWKQLISVSSTPDEVYNTIQIYVADLHSTGGSSYDNHNLHQFEFVLDWDNDNALAQDIVILKTESLTEGMQDLGDARSRVHRLRSC